MNIAMKSRDLARDLVNRVNTSMGKPVLKQPAKKSPEGWKPTFKKGGRLSLNSRSKQAICSYGLGTRNGEKITPVSVSVKPSRKL